MHVNLGLVNLGLEPSGSGRLSLAKQPTTPAVLRCVHLGSGLKLGVRGGGGGWGEQALVVTEAMEQKVLAEHRRRLKAEAECRALRMALTRMQQVRCVREASA